MAILPASGVASCERIDLQVGLLVETWVLENRDPQASVKVRGRRADASDGAGSAARRQGGNEERGSVWTAGPPLML